MGRKLRTQLNLMLPDVGSKVQDCQDRQKHGIRSKERQFDVGSNVYARKYSQGPLWLPGVVRNQDTKVKLQTYTGESIKVCGSTLVSVEHNGQTATLLLIVTAGSGPTLLGRDWLAALQLDWKMVFTVTPTLTLQQVLDEHNAVFKKGLGELQGVVAQIHIDGDVQPIFHKARQVPFAMRKRVEEELEHLQTLGVIQLIQFCDWAAPIVRKMVE